MRAEVEVLSDLCQGPVPDQTRPQSAEVTFGGVRPSFEEQLGRDQIQQAVTKEFQPFVVTGAVTPVSQGPGQQVRVGKLMIDSRQTTRPGH